MYEADELWSFHVPLGSEVDIDAQNLRVNLVKIHNYVLFHKHGMGMEDKAVSDIKRTWQ